MSENERDTMKAAGDLHANYLRNKATVYPVALTYDELCAINGAVGILFDIVCGVRYTNKGQLRRIKEHEVDVLTELSRRAYACAVPPDGSPVEAAS